MKHCFMVMAHSQPEILKKLFSQIDKTDNAIIVHIDKKKSLKEFKSAFDSVKNAKLVVLKKRVRCYWGTYSLVKCEYNLFEEALKINADYYHLISGHTLLIKPYAQFNSFFEKGENKQFFCVEYNQNKEAKGGRFFYVWDRIRYYYLIRSIHTFKFWPRVNNWFRKILLKIQKKLNIDRYKDAYPLAQGSQWFSCTGDFLKYLYDMKKVVKKRFNHTNCSDEIFNLTAYCNSPFYSDGKHNNGLTYIKWDKNNPSPTTFTMADYDKIMSSDMIFARKFDLKTDAEIVDKIVEYTNKQI